MLNSNVTIDSNVKILRSGVFTREGGEVSFQYVVFDTAEAQTYARSEGRTPECGQDIAETLTGWCSSYAGAGQRFCSAPYAQTYGKKMIVIQRCGMDV